MTSSVRSTDHLVTTLLDVVGLLLVAAGLGAVAYPALRWGCLVVSGLVVLAGSWTAARLGGTPDESVE